MSSVNSNTKFLLLATFGVLDYTSREPKYILASVDEEE